MVNLRLAVISDVNLQLEELLRFCSLTEEEQEQRKSFCTIMQNAFIKAGYREHVIVQP